MNNFEKIRLDELWSYPLFEALARRRSLRFPLGCEMINAPYSYKSKKEPVPLSDLELAILCWAGHGITGSIAGAIDATCNTFNSWIGRTHPNPCNDHKQDLLFYNDDGVFLYRPKPNNVVVEIKTVEDREKILTQYKEGLVKLQDGRPSLPDASWIKMNQWKENKPGTTTFMPVTDTTYEYINFLFAAFDDERWQIFDDRKGISAGIQKWIDNGYLNGPVVPISMLEGLMRDGVGGTGHYMVQNIGLASAAMGLNGHPWSGFVAMILMGGTPFSKGLGFRFVTGNDKMPTPVGIDGILESMAKPYHDPDEAVDIFLEEKFGPKGIFGAEYEGITPFKDKMMASKVIRPSQESEKVVRTYLHYLYDTYGRFPALIDAVAIPVAYTVAHADFDFYDQYLHDDYLSDTVKNHMKVWHNQG